MKKLASLLLSGALALGLLAGCGGTPRSADPPPAHPAPPAPPPPPRGRPPPPPGPGGG